MNMNHIAVGMVLAGLLLAGCAGKTATGGDAEELLRSMTEQQQTLAGQCEPGKEWWRAQGTPIRGGILRHGVGGAQHLDPTAPGGRYANHAGAMEYLVKPRSCSYGDTVMVGDLARSWEISPDGLIWTLKLREDARWHDKPPVNGRAFTSADVGWTIDYQKKEGLLRSTWEPVTWETPDPATIVLRMREPDADFMLKLVDEPNVMLAREVKEQSDFKTTLIGTGPFMLKEFRSDQHTYMERVPNYRDMGADGKPLPYLNEVQGTRFPDKLAAFAALRSGLMDGNTFPGGGVSLQKRDADSLKKTEAKLNAQEAPLSSQAALFLNLTEKPWNDARIRRAVSLVIDREELISATYGENGGLQSGFVIPAISEFAWPQAKIKERFKPDPDAARALVAQAGHTPPVKPYTLATSTAPEQVQAAEIIQRQLKDIGLPVEIQARAGSAIALIAKGDWDMAWGMPGSILFPGFWVGDLVRTGSSRNVTRFSDPKVDALAISQMRELDPAKRRQIIDQMQDYLYEQMPYVPGVTPFYYFFQNCRVQNARSPSTTYSIWWQAHVWLDESATCQQ